MGQEGQSDFEGGAERFLAKRMVGISTKRRDGSRCSPETDRQSYAAEKFVAQYLGVPFNDRITSCGDGHVDFRATGLDGCEKTIDAKWLGAVEGKPREAGHLIVNLEEPPVDIYILVKGMIPDFKICGGATRAQLEASPRKDFGYGSKLNIHMRDLVPVETLLRRNGRE